MVEKVISHTFTAYKTLVEYVNWLDVWCYSVVYLPKVPDDDDELLVLLRKYLPQVKSNVSVLQCNKVQLKCTMSKERFMSLAKIVEV